MTISVSHVSVEKCTFLVQGTDEPLPPILCVVFNVVANHRIAYWFHFVSSFLFLLFQSSLSDKAVSQLMAMPYTDTSLR